MEPNRCQSAIDGVFWKAWKRRDLIAEFVDTQRRFQTHELHVARVTIFIDVRFNLQPPQNRQQRLQIGVPPLGRQRALPPSFAYQSGGVDIFESLAIEVVDVVQDFAKNLWIVEHSVRGAHERGASRGESEVEERASLIVRPEHDRCCELGCNEGW